MTSTKTRFQHSYGQLGNFFSRVTQPTPVQAPQWIAFNQALADSLSLPEALRESETTLLLYAGNLEDERWRDSDAADVIEPRALAYAGHQFGHFVPQLGDGRALLLTEVVPEDSPHKTFDIQLKGAGPTAFSRGGDGRSPIGPVLREYLVSEAMHHLGVPTTRALAAVASGEYVYRDSPLPGAILTRVASSHIRVGTFQFAAAHGGVEHVKKLADYTINRHFPELLEGPSGGPRYLALLQQVMQRQAHLIAEWTRVGFVHGVMNTDNTSICGETIDYGPCAFLDTFINDKVFSSIDRNGRYRFSNQPRIAQWNLARLAETLLPLIDDKAPNSDERTVALLTDIIRDFPHVYAQKRDHSLARKFGIASIGDLDEHGKTDLLALMDEFYQAIEADELDHTLAFSSLTQQADRAEGPFSELAKTTKNAAHWPLWRKRWLTLLNQAHAKQPFSVMAQANPRLIPRNHRVQQIIHQAEESGDLTEFFRCHRAWSNPYNYADLGDNRDLLLPPEPNEQVTRTFCGT